MIRRRVLTLLLFFILSCSFIGIAYKITNYLTHRPNSFVRFFPPHLITPVRSIDLNFNSYYLAGASSNKIYLGNSSVPDLFMSASCNLQDTQTIRIGSLRKSGTVADDILTEVDSPYIYFKQGRKASIQYSRFGDSSTINSFNLDSNFFSTCVVLSPVSFVIRSYNKYLQQNILRKISFHDTGMSCKNYLLEKQTEGFFSTDGLLQYEPASASIIYVYHYRNQFLRLDTNLHLIYEARTIDTNTIAKISIAEIKSDKLFTFSQPPLMINHRSCTDKDYILVNSELKSNNEIDEAFHEHAVIDVYDLLNGKYKFSFYTDKLLGKQIRGCGLFNKTFFILSDHYLMASKANF